MEKNISTCEVHSFEHFKEALLEAKDEFKDAGKRYIALIDVFYVGCRGFAIKFVERLTERQISALHATNKYHASEEGTTFLLNASLDNPALELWFNCFIKSISLDNED